MGPCYVGAACYKYIFVLHWWPVNNFCIIFVYFFDNNFEGFNKKSTNP